MRLPVNKPLPVLVYGGYTLSLAIWAGTSVVGKEAVAAYPVFTLLFLRFVLASAMMLPLFWWQQRRTPLAWGDAGKLMLLGLVGFTISIGCFFAGITTSSVLDASVILAMGPLLIAGAGWWLLKERFSILNLLGFAIAMFAATVALTGNSPATPHSLVGNILLGISELAAVVYTIGAKEIVARLHPIHIATISFVTAMVTFAPLSLWEWWQRPVFPTPSGSVWLGLLYMAALSAVLGYLIFEWSLRYMSATSVGALSYIQPLISIVLAVVFLSEKVDLLFVLGGLGTLVGIVLAVHQPELKGRRAHEVLHARHPRQRR